MKLNSFSRIVCFSLAVFFPAANLMADELPPLPVRTFIGVINGMVNIWIGRDDVGSNFWFQVKGATEDDSAYATVGFTKNSIDAVAKIGSFTTSHAFSRDANFVGAATFRVACTNAAGEHAGWVVAGTVTNIMHHVGSAMGVNGGYGVYTKLKVADGVVSTYVETALKYAGSSNLWYGVDLNSPVEIAKIRYVPRQTEVSSLAQLRLGGDIFEVATQSDFSDAVQIGVPVPDTFALGGVLEMVLDEPVTARYVRVKHLYKHDSYLAIAELECCPASLISPINVSTSPSDFTNMYSEVSWSVPFIDQCITAVVERAYSPAGPFVEISAWSDATTGGTCRDDVAAVGVPCYYRVKAWCEGGIRRMLTSDVVRYIRSRRLERDPLDLFDLRSGVSVLPPFDYRTDIPNKRLYNIKLDDIKAKIYDGDTSTWVDISCYTTTPVNASYRIFNPAVGVDFGEGAEFHVVGTYVFPRSNNLPRAREMAIYGANESDLSDRKQLSAKLGGFATAAWQYNFSTNTTDAFRYVFLLSPTESATYGNVAEVGFYGFADQDIIDSGVLIPPTAVSCATNRDAVVLSWDRGWNAASYRVERRKAGAEAWTAVASLSTNVFEYADCGVPRKGVWQWRVSSVSDVGESISTLPCSSYYDPNRGLAIMFR